MVVFLFGLGWRPSLNCWVFLDQVVVAFSVCRTGNVWRLKMKDCATEGTFGTLGAAMRSAYLLADGLKDWSPDSPSGTA